MRAYGCGVQTGRAPDLFVYAVGGKIFAAVFYEKKQKDKQLESSLNALIAANDKNALICLIINIILGIAVAALIVLQIVKAVNKKKSKE